MQSSKEHSVDGIQVFAQLADDCFERDEIDKAIKICLQGLRHHPNYVDAHLVLGKCYTKKGYVDEARAEFETVLQLSPSNLHGLRFLGDLFLSIDRHEMAVDYYQKILAIDPSQEEVKTLLGGFGPSKGKLPKAEPELIEDQELDEWLQMIEKESESPCRGDFKEGMATATLAEIYFQQGLLNEAVEIYRQVLDRNPDDQKVRQRLEELEHMEKGEGSCPTTSEGRS